MIMKKLSTLILVIAMLAFIGNNTFCQTKLEVEGGLKVSNSTTNQEGVIRWNPITQDFEGYNGENWVSFTKTSTTWGVTETPQYQATENQKLIASDGSMSDNFGISVALYGDVAVIGAPYDALSGTDRGSAYIFERSAGVWNETGQLTASVGIDLDRFGVKVAIEGDVIVVGANPSSLAGDGGKAYVFKKPPSGWTSMTETAILTASDRANGDRFGSSLGISGDVILVGAYYDDLVILDEGSAYLFEKPPTGWISMTETAKLTASTNNSQDYFGVSVAIDGDVAIIGEFDDDLSGLNEGSAYIFEKPSGGWITMNETYKLTASDGSNNDLFGGAVDISGDVVIISAYQDNLSGTQEGSAYIFEKPSGGWTNMTETAKLTASDAANSNRMGISVAIYDDIAIAGAYQDNLTGTFRGSAYVFEKPSTGWKTMTESAKLIASDGADSDYFGISLDVYDHLILVGAYSDDLATSDEGSAYIFQK